MSVPTIPRRTYTTRHPEQDDSSIISTEISSSTESVQSASASEESSESNIITDSHGREIGKPLNKSDPKRQASETVSLGGASLSADEKKIAEFIDMLVNHNDPKKSKQDLLENFIRKNASDVFMRKMTKVADKEIGYLKGNEPAKWLSILVSGMLSQLSSFSASSEVALAAKQAWLFPVLATILNEGFSDKAAALTRRTTFVTNDTKNLYRKQRLLARAFGDLIRQCSGLAPVAKYRSNNPAYKGQKFTAWEAFWKDTDHYLAISAHNMVNRGLPFLCFTGTYLARDAVLQTILKGGSSWQTLAVRLGAGAIAGGLTAVTNQIITRNNKDAKENPGHSTSYWHAREEYLLSVRADIRDRLNEAGSITDQHLKHKIENLLHDLDKKIQREIDVAVLKKSKWSAIPGEIKSSIQRSRAEDSLDPEAPGSLSQSMHNAFGKFISLLYFTYMLDQSWNSKDGTGSFSPYPVLNFVMLPVALILMGFMWRDDAQIFSRLAHGGIKGAMDATVRRKDYQEKTGAPLTEVVTSMPREVIDDNGNDADNIVHFNDVIVEGTSDSSSESSAETRTKQKLTTREIEAKDRKLAREAREKPSAAGTTRPQKTTDSSLLISRSESSDDSDSEQESSTAKLIRRAPEKQPAGKEYERPEKKPSLRGEKDKSRAGTSTSARGVEAARLMSSSHSSQDSDSESDDERSSASRDTAEEDSSSFASSTESYSDSSSSESPPRARKRNS